MPESTFIVTRFYATNDTNGNPRRVFVFQELRIYPNKDVRNDYYDTNGYTLIVFTLDEGYGSLRSAMEQFRERGWVGPVVDHGAVAATVTQYRHLVKWQKTNDAQS